MNKMIRSGVGMLFASFAFWATFTILGAAFFNGMDNRLIMTIGSPERRYFYSHVGIVVVGALSAMLLIGALAFWRAGALLRPRMLPLGKVAAGLGVVLFLLTLVYLPFLAIALGSPGLKHPPSVGPNPQTTDPGFVPG